MKLKIGAAVMVMLSVLSGAPQITAATEQSWQTISTENFVIEYQDGYESDANRIGELTETAREELLNQMPSDAEPSLQNKVNIRVYPESKWQRSEGTLYWKNTEPVRIHVLAKSDSSQNTDWYERGLAHEYANIVLWDEASDEADYSYWNRNPSWFGEGLSQYYVYSTDTVRDQMPYYGIEDLNETIQAGSGTFPVISQERYAGGHLLSMYMLHRYDEDAVWGVLRSDDDTFSSAVESNLGVSYSEFKLGWLEWAEENIGGDYESHGANAELQQRVEALQSQLEQQNQTLSELRTELEARNETVSELQSKLAARNESLATLQAELEKRNETVEQLRNSSDTGDVTFNVAVQPAAGEEFVEGETASVSVSDDLDSASELQIQAGDETYEMRSDGTVSIPLQSAGEQTLTLMYGQVTESVTIQVEEPAENPNAGGDHSPGSGDEPTNGSGPGFGLLLTAVSIVAVVAFFSRRRG